MCLLIVPYIMYNAVLLDYASMPFAFCLVLILIQSHDGISLAMATMQRHDTLAYIEIENTITGNLDKQ